MRKAEIIQQGVPAGILEEASRNSYSFKYFPDYQGEPVSLTMPVREAAYEFTKFPAPFEGVLPEGPHLEALLKHYKLDPRDYFGQLIEVGDDLVGSLTVRETS